MNKKLVDVSEFNSTINWPLVKKSGIDYAIIRAGGRFAISGKIYKDKQATNNITECINNKINIGLYFFTQAVNETEAKEEAIWTMNLVKRWKKNITLPIYIDTEYIDEGRHNKITRAQRTKVVNAFCNEIEKAGYKSGVYASTSWLENNLIMGDIGNYSVWVADYRGKCYYKGKYDIWQYTSNGQINGIGKCDLNILYKDFSEKEKEYKDDIKIKAVDVILGKYGNGADRVKALGKDYKEVQSLVNELIGRLE